MAKHIHHTGRVCAAVLMISVLTGCAAKGQAEPDKTIVIDPSVHSVFNDTNGDGYGEFEGFGTSLCWWANRVGYSDVLTDTSCRAFFDADDGLGMTIGRYNIGGGDNVAPEGEAVSDDDDIDTPHASHIRRSDSVVPGYACDVTRIDTSEHDISWYEENFDRADGTSGYAWNYDWNADTNQMNVLKAAIGYAGEENFHAEAFSNSPPYFMTESGCSSGNIDAGDNNLRDDSYDAFAAYLADVTLHFENEGIDFKSISPMNEPGTSYWGAYSDKQEGCHFDSGEPQSRIITALAEKFGIRGTEETAGGDGKPGSGADGPAVIIAGTDETSIDSASWSYSQLSDEAKNVLSRIDTHSYTGSGRGALRMLAEKEGKNLWMSEVDGTFTAGKGAGSMAMALGLSGQIKSDLNGMFPSAWILWDAIDVHIDSTNKYDWHSRNGCLKKLDLGNGNSLWGILIADHDAKELIYTRKYYAFGQYSRYIKPGMCLVASGDFTVAAYDPAGGKIVIVATNNNSDDLVWKFDLSGFEGELPGKKDITVIRTSGDDENGESWSDVSKECIIGTDKENKTVTASIKGQSITTFIIGAQNGK